jgi:amino acid transporter
MVFFAYMGFQVITMMGGEVKQSSKSVPVAMLASILIVAVIYIGVILGLLAADLPTYGSESIFDAASVIMGPVGGSIIALGAVLSTLSSANALTAGASRIIKEMASEEQIPGRFARLRHQEPTNALLLGFCISAVFILYGSLDAILGLVNVAMLIAMVFVNISALKLVTGSHIETNKAYFRVPFGPLFPLLATASCLLMLFTLPLQSIVLGVIALFLGTILYSLEDTPLGKEEITKIRVLLRREIEEEIRPDKS